MEEEEKNLQEAIKLSLSNERENDNKGENNKKNEEEKMEEIEETKQTTNTPQSSSQGFQLFSIGADGKPAQISITGGIASFFSQFFKQSSPSSDSAQPIPQGLPFQIVNNGIKSVEEDEDVISGNAKIISPPPKDGVKPRGRNDEIKDYLMKNFPDRYEDNARRWTCSNCDFSADINQLHYVCDECDDFVLCPSCREFDKAIERHQIERTEIQNRKRDEHFCYFSDQKKKELKHFGTFFYSEERPRWTSKRVLMQQVYTSSDLVSTALSKLYKNRFFIGELIIQKINHDNKEDFRSFKDSFGKVVDDDYKWYTTTEVWLFITRLAKAFQSLGISKGDYVAISAENRLEWAIVDFCCTFIGIVSVAVPGIITKEAASVVLSSVPLKAIFVSNQSAKTIISSLNNTNIKQVILFDEISEDLTKFFSETNDKPTECQLLSFTLLIEISSAIDNEPISGNGLDENEIITIMFTSGSTGVPKGVQFNERKWITQITLPLTLKNVVLYGYLPLDHIAGRTDLYTALFNGGRIFFNQTLSNMVGASKISKYIEDLQTIRPTAFGPVPIICNAAYHKFKLVTLQKLSLIGGNEGEETSKNNIDKELKKQVKNEIREGFRYVFGDRISSVKVTSAPVTSKIVHFLRETLLVAVHEGYGSTEVGSISNDQNVTQTVKLLSVPELKYLITNDPPQGEILVKNLRTSYVNPRDNELKTGIGGWFHTGDIGEVTGPHSIKVIDRKSNVIKLANGEFVALENIELLYLKSPYIHQIFLYADSHKSNIVAIILPFYFDNNNSNEKVIKRENIINNPPIVDKKIFERSLRDSLYSVAVRHNLRSFEIPFDIYIDWDTVEWTSNDGLLTTSNKPCRRNLREKYQQQINSLYLKQSILSTLRDNNNIRNIDLNNNNLSFSELGGDSLSAIQVLNQLKSQSVFGISFEQLMGDQSISELILDNDSSIVIKESKNESLVEIEDEKQYLDTLLSSLSENIQAKYVPPSPENINNIFITGATGFLGKQITIELLKQYPNAKLHCLVRKEGSLSPLSPQIIEIIGNISKERFGLSKEKFSELCEIIDIIIHGAAIVNHLVTYDDLYKTNVESIFNIISLAITSKIKIIHYISSISALRSFYKRTKGYGATKWATDRILQYYHQKYELPVFIYRPSLIIGHSENGEVNKKDWFHRFIKAIVDYKIIPNLNELAISDGNQDDSLNMISLDFCAKSIVTLIDFPHFLYTKSKSIQTLPVNYNIFNIGYQNVGFKKILEMLNGYQEEDLKFQQLLYKDWYSQIDQKIRENRHVASPFIQSFEFGITSSSPKYDTNSLEFALSLCGSNLRFTELNAQEFLKTVKSLQD